MVSHHISFCLSLSHRRLPMKRKKRTSSPKSSSSDSSYLHDECWESIFKFIINDDDDNNNRRNLDSLSLVSKQFLSITNGIQFSLTVRDETIPFLRLLFKRFTNLTSINLAHFSRTNSYNLDELLCKISSFPGLKLTSLDISHQEFFPSNGLRAFLQNITTLTSLNCSSTCFNEHDLLIISECFPLLKQLNLSNPPALCYTSFPTYSLFSDFRCIQHLDLSQTYFLDDTHIAEWSLFFADLVYINLRHCNHLTESTLFSLVTNCPSLSDIRMEYTAIGEKSVDSSGVYPQLKSLYLGGNSRLSDKHIIMFASMFPNLELLDLDSCNHISEGVCQVLRICCKIRHLNLALCERVKLLEMNFVVPQLEVLNLSFTKVDDETLYVISKNCCGLLKILLNNCNNLTEKGVKHVAENCTRLREIYLGDFHLSDKNKKLFSRRGCLLC